MPPADFQLASVRARSFCSPPYQPTDVLVLFRGYGMAEETTTAARQSRRTELRTANIAAWENGGPDSDGQLPGSAQDGGPMLIHCWTAQTSALWIHP